MTGAAEWHINSDEADVIDYDTTFKPAGQEALWEENPYRTSDHDPVRVGLELNAPPTFEFVAGGTCSTSGNGGSFLVNIDDLQTSGAALTVTRTGNTNTTLVPNANVVDQRDRPADDLDHRCKRQERLRQADLPAQRRGQHRELRDQRPGRDERK